MSWFQRLIFGGVDLEAEQARGNELDRALEEENRAALESGRYSQAIYDEAERNRLAGITGDVNAQVGDAFRAGIDEGAGNIRNAVGGTVNAVVGTPFKLIPWQLWLAGALYLAFRFGLFDGIFSRFKK